MRFLLLLTFLAAAACYGDDRVWEVRELPEDMVVEETPVVINDPPVLLAPPGLGVYVAVDAPYDLFYDGHGYYLYDDGRWLTAAGYQGPWVAVTTDKLPRALSDMELEELRHLRDLQAQKYEEQGKDYHGRVLFGPPTATEGSKRHRRHDPGN